MAEEGLTYLMTTKEFFFLTQMLGLSRIAGYSDPYRGYLVEEIEEDYQEIRSSLVEKGWLKTGETDDYTDMDEALALCLSICGSSQVIEAAKTIIGQDSYAAFLYFHPRLVVEVVYSEAGEVQVTPVSEPLGVMEMLRAFFPLTLRSSREFKQYIPDCNWKKWLSLASEEKAVLLQAKNENESQDSERIETREDRWHREGGASQIQEEVERVLGAFANGERLGSLVFWSQRGEAWEQEAYHYVQWGKELYMAKESRIEIDQTAGMEIMAYDPDMIWKRLVEFAVQFDLVVEDIVAEGV